ncbi:hypothetical protein LTR56_001959 [Elasticomyces elasticus]|nr:hypothetical protein LTR22_011545 [Elasticomyces elasticus]KAK3658103.1 hypothetical protein LTR56_001959 [Elasticomyces elasticus]KAK4914910.1 hypothetical protein LTR49_016899 [Elasticomyces elasticus]KAK5749115.1 hypothetical protein LTS12_020810 [Elasticomyces elasticus]
MLASLRALTLVSVMSSASASFKNDGRYEAVHRIRGDSNGTTRSTTTSSDTTTLITVDVTSTITLGPSFGSAGGLPTIVANETGLAYASSCNAAKQEWIANTGMVFVSNSTFTTASQTVNVSWSMSDWTTTSLSDSQIYTMCDGYPRLNGTTTVLSTRSSRATTWTTFYPVITPVSRNVSAPTCTIAEQDCSVLQAEYTTSDAAYSSRLSQDRSASITLTTIRPTSPISPICGQPTLLPPVLTSLGPAACAVNTASLQLLYWPVSTVSGDLCHGNASTITATPTIPGQPNTVKYMNTTLTSPTVYFEFKNVYAIGTDYEAKSSYQNTLLPLPSASVSSRCGLLGGGFGGPQSMNYADFNVPVPASAYRCQPKCWTNDRLEQYATMSDFTYEKYATENRCSTIWDDYRPALAVPTEFATVFPSAGFKDGMSLACTFILDESGDNIFFDPPKALTQVQSADGPSAPAPVNAGPTTSTQNISTTSLIGSSGPVALVPAATPDSPTAPIDSANPTPTVVENSTPTAPAQESNLDDPPENPIEPPSYPAQPTNSDDDLDVPAQPDAPADSPSAPAQADTTDVDPATRTQPDQPNNTPNEVPGNVDTAPVDSPPTPTTPSVNDPQGAPSPSTAGPVSPETSTPGVGAIILSALGATSTPNADSGSPVNNEDADAQLLHSQTPQTATVGDQAFTVVPEANDPSVIVVANGQTTATIAPGQTGTIGGQVVSLAPSTSAGIVIGSGNAAVTLTPGGSPSGLASLASTSYKLPVITVGSATISANTASQYVVGTQTLAPGGSTVVVSGTTYSLDPSASGMVANDVTQNLQPDASAANTGSLLVAGGHTFTPDSSSAIVIAGQTLQPGSQTVVAGTTYSLDASASAVAINGVTQDLQPVSPATAIFTANGQTFTAGASSALVIAGQTLQPGSEATIAGTTYSLVPSGSALVVNGATQTAQSLAPATSSDAPVFVVNDQAIHEDLSSNAIISGQTLAPGSATVIDGTTYSLEPSATALVVDGTTHALQPATGSTSGATGSGTQAGSATSSIAPANTNAASGAPSRRVYELLIPLSLWLLVG